MKFVFFLTSDRATLGRIRQIRVYGKDFSLGGCYFWERMPERIYTGAGGEWTLARWNADESDPESAPFYEIRHRHLHRNARFDVVAFSPLDSANQEAEVQQFGPYGELIGGGAGRSTTGLTVGPASHPSAPGGSWTRQQMMQLGLTGKPYDPETGLYYFGYRWYSPKLRRWTQPEPLGLDGPNLYHFNFSDPVNRVDLDGLSSEKERSEEITEKIGLIYRRYKKMRDKGEIDTCSPYYYDDETLHYFEQVIILLELKRVFGEIVITTQQEISAMHPGAMPGGLYNLDDRKIYMPEKDGIVDLLELGKWIHEATHARQHFQDNSFNPFTSPRHGAWITLQEIQILRNYKPKDYPTEREAFGMTEVFYDMYIAVEGEKETGVPVNGNDPPGWGGQVRKKRVGRLQTKDPPEFIWR